MALITALMYALTTRRMTLPYKMITFLGLVAIAATVGAIVAFLQSDIQNPAQAVPGEFIAIISSVVGGLLGILTGRPADQSAQGQPGAVGAGREIREAGVQPQ
jgi:hypothetical protein